MAIFKKADDLGAQLFSSYFPQGSKTFIGGTQSWTDEQLAKNGWVTKCNEPSMTGVAYCVGEESIHGYVVTSDAPYNASNPGADGGSLLAHEYFHLVQRNLSKTPFGSHTKNGQPGMANAFPVWFIEGTADYVGFAVGHFHKTRHTGKGESECLLMHRQKNRLIRMQLQIMKFASAVEITPQLTHTVLGE